ncbi:hypothetical protein ACO2Q3_08140 [Caulobacter sp. KR2-114]|uniref:hypothetical protein n=1 Tax=Caulobacter sp. KR2-114 TaxID=3400912 RepID=UPI003BFC8C16
MSTVDSPIEKVALQRARALLKAPVARDPALAAVAAAALFAVSALALATVWIVLPPVFSEAPHAATQGR